MVMRLLVIFILLWGGATTTPCSTPIVDLGILIEASSRFGINEYVLTKRTLVSLVQHLDVSSTKTHVGIGYYSNSPHIHAELSDDRLYDPIKLMLSILSLPFPGGEARSDLALKMANEKLFAEDKGDRPEVTNVLIVIARGRVGPRNSTYKKALMELKDRGIHIIAIGLGKDANDEDLLEIALGKKDQVFRVTEIQDLNLRNLVRVIKSSC